MEVDKYLSSLTVVPRILGVFPYSISGEFKLKTVETLLSFVFVVFLVVTVTCTETENFLKAQSFMDYKNAAISTFENSVMASCLCVSFYQISFSCNQFNTICRLFYKVDMIFKSLKTNVKNAPAWKINVNICYMWPLFIILTSDVEVYTRCAAEFEIIKWMDGIAHLGCNFKIYGIGWTFSAFTMSLGSYIEHLNGIIRGKGGKKANAYLISEAYDELCKLWYHLNRIFGPVLFMVVLNSYVKCTHNFYKIVCGSSVYWFFIYVLWISLTITQLMLLTISVFSPLTQVNELFIVFTIFVFTRASKTLLI